MGRCRHILRFVKGLQGVEQRGNEEVHRRYGIIFSVIVCMGRGVGEGKLYGYRRGQGRYG